MTPRDENEERAWQAVRERVLERDGRTCKDSSISPCEGELHVHHLIPRSVGGPDAASNCVTLCRLHHAARHPGLQVSLSRRIIERWALRLARWLDFSRELPTETRALSAALHLFGVDRFKAGQLEAILAALNGESLLVVRPTGSGKSLCFQLPAVVAGPPFSLVLSPLKALMVDQVDALHRKRLPATFINGDVTGAERAARYDLLESGALALMYVAPERLDPTMVSPREATRLAELAPRFLVVDEAHVVDRWGFDFRPAYGRIAEVRREMGSPPVLAFTATAGARSQERIKESLGIPEARVIVSDANRPNIALCRVREPSDARRAEIIAQLIDSVGAGKALIFVPTVKLGRAVQQLLEEHGASLPFFYGKLSREKRDQILGGLTGRLNPPVQAVICTSAFGLGVDVPDIRLVVHWQHPGSVEDYLQEFGRAGRDGHPALALLFSGDSGEAGLLRFMADKTAEEALERGLPPEQIERAREQKYEAIAEMAELAGAQSQCFRDALLVALGATSVKARRRLPLRILRRVFEEHPRVERVRACCDACSEGLPDSVRAGLFPLPLRSASTSVRAQADHSAATAAPESTDPSGSSRSSQAPSAVARVADGTGGSRPVEDGQEEAVLSLVGRMPGRLSVGMTTHVLWGSEGPVVKERGLDDLPEYGRLSGTPHKEIRVLVERMIHDGRLERDTTGTVSPQAGGSSPRERRLLS